MNSLKLNFFVLSITFSFFQPSLIILNNVRLIDFVFLFFFLNLILGVSLKRNKIFDTKISKVVLVFLLYEIAKLIIQTNLFTDLTIFTLRNFQESILTWFILFSLLSLNTNHISRSDLITIVEIVVIAIAVMTIALQFLPIEVLEIGGRAEYVSLVSEFKRILFPSQSVILFFSAFFVISFFEEKSVKYVIFSLISLTALLTTYSRTYWVALVIAALFYLFSISIKSGKKVYLLYFALIFLSIMLIIPLETNNLLLSRLTSSFTEIQSEGSTFAWRIFEAEFGIISFFNNPYFGIPVGFPYRDANAFLDASFKNYQFAHIFIHFGLLETLVYHGIVGFLLLTAVFISAIVSKSTSYLHRRLKYSLIVIPIATISGPVLTGHYFFTSLYVLIIYLFILDLKRTDA